MKLRILTAAVALPLLVLLVGYAGSFFFAGAISVIIFLSQLEFARMGLDEDNRLEQWICAFYGALIVPVQLFCSSELVLPLTAAVFLSLAILFLFRFRDIDLVHQQLGWLLLGILYLPVLLGHVVSLRLLADGQRWIFLTLISVMLCDSFAYFVGRSIGKRKLYPSVSPNKTIEGAIGGLLGSVVAVYVVKLSFLPAIGIVDGFFIGLLLGTFGQLGDLFESLLKRACHVKDSGTLIPGHGGLLDRLDSLLFAFPLVFYIAKYGYGG